MTAEPLAYDVLALKPWEFWRLTPREFSLMIEGAECRDDRGWRRVAQLAAWLLQPWSKKIVRADRLLGRRGKRTRPAPLGPPPFWDRDREG